MDSLPIVMVLTGEGISSCGNSKHSGGQHVKWKQLRGLTLGKDYELRLRCPHGDNDVWMTLENRDESVEQLLETYWDFECAIHGVQREVPVEAHERLPLPRGEEPAAKPAAKPTGSRKSAKPRSSARVSVSIPVYVKGIDHNGNPFIQSAYTVDVSKSGARLDGVGYLTGPGDTIEVRRFFRKARFRVIWIGDMGTSEANQIGILCLEEEKNPLRSKLPKSEEE